MGRNPETYEARNVKISCNDNGESRLLPVYISGSGDDLGPAS
mgnify:CR=1 FL=1